MCRRLFNQHQLYSICDILRRQILRLSFRDGYSNIRRQRLQFNVVHVTLFGKVTINLQILIGQLAIFNLLYLIDGSNVSFSAATAATGTAAHSIR